MIKAIGFDWGGVLVDSKPILPGIAKILELPEEVIRNSYFSQNSLANVGDMTYEELWAKIAQGFGADDKIEQIWDHMHTQQVFTTNPDMLSLIKELKQKDYKIGLLSNNTRKNGESIKAEFQDFVDCVLISAEIGFQKPQPEAFNLLFENLGVLPDEAIFTDDSPTSLALADQIGYQPILFQGYENFKNELINLKIL